MPAFLWEQQNRLPASDLNGGGSLPFMADLCLRPYWLAKSVKGLDFRRVKPIVADITTTSGLHMNVHSLLQELGFSEYEARAYVS
ncbi:MAG: hypothetical protein ACRESO_05510, partial [Gammaproteobacteria bacterium]